MLVGYIGTYVYICFPIESYVIGYKTHYLRRKRMLERWIVKGSLFFDELHSNRRGIISIPNTKRGRSCELITKDTTKK